MKIIIAIISALWLSTGLFVLDERELAVVTMFGDPIETIAEPGLKVKFPWPIQVVHRFDRRSQLLDVEVQEAFTKDTKNLVLKPYVVWKIQDASLFLERVNTTEQAARPINDIVTSQIGSAIGEIEFGQVFTVDDTREQLLPVTILDSINNKTIRLGITVQQVRLQRLSLPVQNEQSIYERMRAERSRIAGQYRAEGEEEAIKIRAEADRKSTEIKSNAEKEAAVLISTAEHQAAELYAKSYQQNPALYKLLRDLESVESTLEDGGTLILPADKRPFSTLLVED
jgi:modulator of FtsH protease HflC